ncbi:MAG: hypothetical protein ABID09_07745 [Candidatus Omnitrophota bacterium]
MFNMRVKLLRKLLALPIVLAFLFNVIVIDAVYAVEKKGYTSSKQPKEELPSKDSSDLTKYLKHVSALIEQKNDILKEISQKTPPTDQNDSLTERLENHGYLDISEITLDRKGYECLIRDFDLPLDDIKYLPEDILLFYKENGTKETLEYIKYAKEIYGQRKDKPGKDTPTEIPRKEKDPPPAKPRIIDEPAKIDLPKPYPWNPYQLGEDFVSYVEDVALHVFDDNGNGLLDGTEILAQDERLHSRRIGSFYYSYSENGSYGGSEFIFNHHVRDLLGFIFIYIAQDYWNATPQEIAPGVLATFTESDDGNQYTVTLTGDAWTITILYKRPPGVDTTTVTEMRRIFAGIEEAMDGLSHEFDNLEKEGGEHPAGATPDREKLRMELGSTDILSNDGNRKEEALKKPYAPKGESDETGETVESERRTVSASRSYKNTQKTDSPRDKDVLFKKGEKVLEGAAISFNDVDQNTQIDNETSHRKGYSLLDDQWRDAKTVFDKAFEKVLYEEAGAVSSGDGAVILLKSFKVSDDSDEESEEDDGESDQT